MKEFYDIEKIPMTEDEVGMARIGFGSLDTINQKIKEIINRRASEGWEPLYPFSVPDLWFRRKSFVPKKKK